MSTSKTRIELEAVATDVKCTADRLHITLADGRELSVPLEWFPRLARASGEERANWRLSGRGTGIHWPMIDEDISVENLFLPKASLLRAKH